ncbi:MAG TPA: hypothetical protein VMM82_12495, partial [Spirochaetia bacterium]|nr:hypothetical protein [Spirochaetia bacterium]
MKLTGVALLLILPFILAECQSVPKVQDPSGVSVSVVALTDDQVMMYYGQGAPFEPDPYIAPGGIFSSRVTYVVLRVEIDSRRNAFVMLNDAAAKDATGSVVARVSSKRDFLT